MVCEESNPRSNRHESDCGASLGGSKHQSKSLSIHTKINILELIYDGNGSMVSYKPIIRIPTNEEKSVNVTDLMKPMSLSKKKMVEEKIQANK